MKRLRPYGWLLLAAGVLSMIPPAYVTYANWQESTLTQEWEAKFPAEPDRVPVPAVSVAEPAARVSSLRPGAVAFVLKIPRLGYAAAVREGVSSSILSVGPGHYPTTPEPGQPGDVGVAAHNTYWLGFGAVRPGDQIVLEASDGVYTYTVTGTKVVSPDETWVLYQPGASTLTLTTCWPLWAGALAQERLAIFAELSPRPVGVVA